MTTNWLLEHHNDGDRLPQRRILTDFPVLIGRQDGLTLADASPNLSRYHAELIERGSRLFIRDLGSRNGTFVNRERIEQECELFAGDLVHFADIECRLSRTAETARDAGESTAILTRDELPDQAGAGSDQLENSRFESLFQPIVSLLDEQVVAHECLTRGTHDGRPQPPDALLDLAASHGEVVILSERMRLEGLAAAEAAGLTRPVFVNTHPQELDHPERLLAHLRETRQHYPRVQLVVELHEAAIPTLGVVAELASALHDLDIGLAYDDFGAGQARLMELISAPPQYLKFDRSLLTGIDQGPARQRRMVAMLVGYAHEHGIRTIAEGIAEPREAKVCLDLGFDYAQGYYFGEPGLLPGG